MTSDGVVGVRMKCSTATSNNRHLPGKIRVCPARWGSVEDGLGVVHADLLGRPAAVRFAASNRVLSRRATGSVSLTPRVQSALPCFGELVGLSLPYVRECRTPSRNLHDSGPDQVLCTARPRKPGSFFGASPVWSLQIWYRLNGGGRPSGRRRICVSHPTGILNADGLLCLQVGPAANALRHYAWALRPPSHLVAPQGASPTLHIGNIGGTTVVGSKRWGPPWSCQPLARLPVPVAQGSPLQIAGVV